MDSKTTITELKQLVDKMVTDRNWKQFHTPKDMAICVSIEAAELLEHFQWNKPEGHPITDENRLAIEHEAADVLMSLLLFCLEANIDISDALVRKLKIMDERYPVATSYGKFDKH